MLERTGIFLWKMDRITSLSQLSGRWWNINTPAQGTLDQINLLFKQLEDLYRDFSQSEWIELNTSWTVQVD